MKQKLSGLIAILLATSLIMTASASYTQTEGIKGYVHRCGIPAQGIIVRVYNASDILEGYGVADNTTTPWIKGTLGTDITDENGYYHIAWLRGHLEDFTVIAETPLGDVIGTVHVEDLGCGETRRVNFCYCPGVGAFTIGYWKNHPEAWPVTSLTIGGETLDQNQLLSMLQNAKSKDATNMLAAQLIAAKLNVENGADASTDVLDAISEADAFLTPLLTKLGSDPRGEDRDYALMLKDILDWFNNGF